MGDMCRLKLSRTVINIDSYKRSASAGMTAAGKVALPATLKHHFSRAASRISALTGFNIHCRTPGHVRHHLLKGAKMFRTPLPKALQSGRYDYTIC